jgi:hypothetical protein
MNKESREIGIRSEFGIQEVSLFLGSWLPD